jgi:pimeloyl-ACP methyl ester carboxylesterase
MRMLSVGDSQLEVWDRGTGASLVFIHGVVTSGQMWAADLAELANDLRLIVYNRRGYGASSSSPQNWEAHGDDAVALIETLNAAPAVVIGYSGGAIVALNVVLKRPDLVARLVLLDPAVNLKRCLTPGFLRTIATVRLLRWLRGDRAAAERWLRYVSEKGPKKGTGYVWFSRSANFLISALPNAACPRFRPDSRQGELG